MKKLKNRRLFQLLMQAMLTLSLLPSVASCSTPKPTQPGWTVYDFHYAGSAETVTNRWVATPAWMLWATKNGIIAP